MRRFLKNFEEYVGGTLFIVMFIVLVAQIIARQVFDQPIKWSEELARFLFVYIGFLGVSAGIKDGQHVAITFLLEKFPPKIQRVMQIVFQLAILGILVVLFIIGVRMTIRKIPVTIVSLKISYMYMYIALPITTLLMIYRLLERNFNEFIRKS
ncbi:TRAP transporter small permease [Natronincola ferrireducens]|uniref:TRAP-type C4-dicarboxylate transport system, small permease component n=1 Tax=Natronincola ferrireducens TaxID=393762 RepID=A0A1G9A6D1_9FIRM|nr:TRAP transporter small permease [Natronincola ferrireducens]SDK22771.1 TRAP-type C4-dicarboxylate transport system, small permease component [Natronincola ferrireducens]